MKNQPILLIASALCLAILSSTAPVTEQAPALDMDKIKTEIQALEDAYAAAENAKNAEAVLAYYADDAVNMPNDKPSVVGKKAILARIKEDMAGDTTVSTIVFKVMDIKASGNHVVEVGSSTITGAGGKVSTGKYMSVFEKRDGKYACIRDIWNDDAP